MTALVPVIGQSWPIKDVVSGCGKDGQRKDWKRYSEAQQRLEGKGQEKSFEQAMIGSPMGGIYEAQPAAEPRKSVRGIGSWWSIWCIGGGSS